MVKKRTTTATIIITASQCIDWIEPILFELWINIEHLMFKLSQALHISCSGFEELSLRESCIEILMSTPRPIPLDKTWIAKQLWIKR